MGLLTYITAKLRKVLLPCKRSFVWMWPIKLNVRSTWQAERGRRTKKTAMVCLVLTVDWMLLVQMTDS